MPDISKVETNLLFYEEVAEYVMKEFKRYANYRKISDLSVHYFNLGIERYLEELKKRERHG